MGKLFGTDGVRGIVNEDLTVDLAIKIGAAVSRVLKEKLDTDELTFIIGGDTRSSRDMLSSAVSVGVLSEGCNVIDVGVLPTPGISYLTSNANYDADGAFVISASHNPVEYNGIKVLDRFGMKLSDELEEECEKIILSDFEINKDINRYGSYTRNTEAIHDYFKYLFNEVDADYNKLARLNPLVDPANGAACDVAGMFYPRLFDSYNFINDFPNGLNINKDAGSTHIEGLKKEVVEGQYDLGIAFDGDADRCILVDELGNEVDGDVILAIVGKYLKSRGKLRNNTIVGTVMSNLGLVKFCEENGINFVKTPVGDKYVLKEMLEKDYIIGGEQSGHIIFKDHANTGDGELTAIMIMNIMINTHKKLSELASVMKKYPQVLKNIEATKAMKDAYKNREDIQEYVEKLKKDLGNDYNVVIRPSGTENLIRVMIEGKDIEDITKICDGVVEYLTLELSQDPFVRKRK